MIYKGAALLLLGLSLCCARPQDGRSQEDKQPYSFAWQASRHYNGAPDREHREQRGDDGITRGVFRYVDPSLQVQEVIYTADADGFVVQNDVLPQDTQAGERARANHQAEFDRIAQEHRAIGEERGQEPYVYDPSQYDNIEVDPDSIPHPEFRPAVARARSQHQSLFEEIAAQHARIAAERKTPIPEETGGPYE